MSSGAEVVFNTIVPPGLTPFMQQLHDAGFTRRGGHLVCTYFDENCLGLVPAEQVEGLYSCLDYYQDASDPFSKELLGRYDERYPDSAMFTGGSACSGTVPRHPALGGRGARGGRRSIRTTSSQALDHAKIAVGPGRPGGDGARSASRSHEHVHRPGAQGALQIVKSVGVVAPDERVVQERAAVTA